MPTYNNLPAPSDHFKGKWYRQLIEDLQLAGKARRTIRTCTRGPRGWRESRWLEMVAGQQRPAVSSVAGEEAVQETLRR